VGFLPVTEITDASGQVNLPPLTIYLAHEGVLFLDELPELEPRVLDSLRQPLEYSEVSVSQANHRVTYPARFMLVAAMNPCRCGQAYDPGYPVGADRSIAAPRTIRCASRAH
jgi:predicted ATPase with chaperone activity